MDTLAWEEPIAHRMKVERNLNFSTLSNEEDEFGFSRKKTARDPMSHRIIEKRRRDRMNNCLADLSRLVPANYLKKGRGRIEKTEIIEMAIKHLKHLQSHPCQDPVNCEIAKSTEADHKRQFRMGYQECLSETIRFAFEVGELPSTDSACTRLIAHLQKHYEKLAGGMCYTEALGMMMSEDSKSNILEMDSQSAFHLESGSFGYDPSRNPAVKVEMDSKPPLEHKVTSQLREMLQNPGLPKDTKRSASPVNGMDVSPVNGMDVSPVNGMDISPVNGMTSGPASQECNKNEEGYYKFKSNIKHRFVNDLRHHAPSPTDSSYHSDRVPDEDPPRPDPRPPSAHGPDNKRRCPSASGGSPERPRPTDPKRLCGPEDRGPVVSPDAHRVAGHAFTPYPGGHSDLHPFQATHWEQQVETGSSCGSNPSPPPSAPRSSNGSSSGYSTSGDGGLKPSPRSPDLSPFPRTPDRLSNRSPSPLHPTGVPIFALHPKGSFYIPLTVETSLLIPYMTPADDLAPVLHPISICVNLSHHSAKVPGAAGPLYRPTFLLDKFQDRFVHQDKSLYYPASPTRNGCA